MRRGGLSSAGVSLAALCWDKRKPAGLAARLRSIFITCECNVTASKD